jgi:Ca-activated chloride channel family protein
MFLLLWIGLTLLAVGTAGPQWGRDWSQTATRGRDLVVVLDLSRSMLAENPSRFQRARESLRDLCATVRKHGGHRLGLVVFAGHAQLACPLTNDYDHFLEIVTSFEEDYLDPLLWPEENARSGTRIGEGLTLAVEAHREQAQGSQDILLLSDGDDPAGEAEGKEEWRDGIEAAQKRGIPIHTIGIGDPLKAYLIPLGDETLFHDGDKVMTRLEEKPLQEIARKTGGRYVPLHTSDYPLGELYLATLASGADREHGIDALPVYRQQAVWFLVPAFVLLAATFFIGDARHNRFGVSR